MSSVFLTISAFFFVAASLGVCFLIAEIAKEKARPSRRKNRSAPGRSTKIPAEVLLLVQGDRKVAQRLIHYTRQSNPGRSYKWVIEKVIHDLERDRH